MILFVLQGFSPSRYRFIVDSLLVLLVFVLTAVAYSNLPILYDGSYYLINIVLKHTPFVPNSRYMHWLLGWPTVATISITQSIELSKLVFCLTYLAPSLIGLSLCWFIVRELNPGYFIWPALGICLSALPGVPCYIVETTLAMQLTWPCVMAFFVGKTRLGILLLLIVGPLLFCTHPLSGGFLMVIAIYIYLSSLTQKNNLFWLSIFVGLASIGSFIRFLFIINDYERGVLTAIYRSWFDVATSSIPFLIGGTPLVASILFIYYRESPKRLLSVVLMLGYGMYIFKSVIFGNFLSFSLEFRFLMPMITLPYFFLPWLEQDINKKKHVRESEYSNHAVFTALVLIIYMSTLLISSIQWYRLNGALQDVINRKGSGCINVRDLPIHNNIIYHWSLTSLTLIMQNMIPNVVITPDCARDYSDTSFNLAPWHPIQRKVHSELP